MFSVFLFFISMQALSKALPDDDLTYLRAQFSLLEPRDGFVSLENFRVVSARFLQISITLRRVIKQTLLSVNPI
jgi:hypothetical protein